MPAPQEAGFCLGAPAAPRRPAPCVTLASPSSPPPPPLPVPPFRAAHGVLDRTFVLRACGEAVAAAAAATPISGHRPEGACTARGRSAAVRPRGPVAASRRSAPAVASPCAPSHARTVCPCGEPPLISLTFSPGGVASRVSGGAASQSLGAGQGARRGEGKGEGGGGIRAWARARLCTSLYRALSAICFGR